MEFHLQALSNLCRVCPAFIKPGSQSIDAILFAKEISAIWNKMCRQMSPILILNRSVVSAIEKLFIVEMEPEHTKEILNFKYLSTIATQDLETMLHI